MDCITIKDLEIYAYHGVNKEEKKLGQKFIISLQIYLDLSKAGTTDDISHTVNYAEIVQDIKKVCTCKTYNLIEALAEKIALFILNKYGIVGSIRVKVKKPWAPIDCNLDYICVSIYRER